MHILPILVHVILVFTPARKSKVATLAQENESLRLLLADGANGEELAALAAGAKVANAARRVSLVAVKREGERGEGGGERGRVKRARK